MFCLIKHKGDIRGLSHVDVRSRGKPILFHEAQIVPAKFGFSNISFQSFLQPTWRAPWG